MSAKNIYVSYLSTANVDFKLTPFTTLYFFSLKTANTFYNTNIMHQQCQHAHYTPTKRAAVFHG